jgi:DNA-binding NarL/FixJ family response regulator
MTEINVLVAETRPLLLIALDQVLRDAPGIRLVATCSNYETAIHEVIQQKPDVIILDLGIVSGIEEIQNFRQARKDMPIILFGPMLSRFKTPLSILETKANGYIDLDVFPTRLIDAVKLVHGGGYLMSPNMTNRLIERVAHREETGEIKSSNLSKREKDVLELLARGLTNKEIAEKLFITESTAKAHLHSILTKMGTHSRVSAVFKARENGIIP